jgi:hypothetical protein
MAVIRSVQAFGHAYKGSLYCDLVFCSSVNISAATQLESLIRWVDAGCTVSWCTLDGRKFARRVRGYHPAEAHSAYVSRCIFFLLMP